jgi:hypothetical protein
MSRQVAEGKSAFSEGIDYVNMFLDRMPLSSSIAFVTNDLSTQNSSNKLEIQERLTTLDYANERFDLEDILASAKNTQLYLISDFQKSSFDPLDFSDSSTQVVLVPIQAKNEANVTIDTVYFDSPVILPNQANQLNVDLKNYGNEGYDELLVKLLNGDQLISSTTVSIDAKGRTKVYFQVDPASLRSSELMIEINDYPVVFDNEYYLAFPGYEKPSIYYVYGQTSNPNIESVYANKKLFNFFSYQQGAIDFSQISKADLLILEGFEAIPDWIYNLPATTTKLIIPAIGINEASYSRYLGVRISPSSDSSVLNLNLPDESVDFFTSIFENFESNADFPSSRIFYQVNGPFRPILKDDFNRVFLGNSSTNNALYFFTTPLENRYTNFLSHSLFLPVFYRIAQSSNQSDEPLYYTLNQSQLSFSINQSLSKDLRVKGPMGTFIPNRNLVGQNLTLELPPDDIQPGFYYVLNGNDTLKVFALNLDDSESNLATFSTESLGELFPNQPNLTILQTDSSLDFAQKIERSGTSDDLWKLMLVLSCLFLLAEVLLVRFYK